MMLKKNKILVTAISSAALLISTMAQAQSENSHSTPFVGQLLSDLTESHPDIATNFTALTKSVTAQLPWITNYGTATPGAHVSVNGHDYVAFWGCEPHNCTNSAYTVLVDPQSKAVVKGAVRIDTAAEQEEAPTSTTVIWLGGYDYDFVPTLWQQFFPLGEE